MHGAAFLTLHMSPESLMSDVQHPSPRPEHPDPPHDPQLTGQHVPLASNPSIPITEHGLIDWAEICFCLHGSFVRKTVGGAGGGGGRTEGEVRQWTRMS